MQIWQLSSWNTGALGSDCGQKAQEWMVRGHRVGKVSWDPGISSLVAICPSERHETHEPRKNLVGWFLQGIILPNCIGIIINHYKDPYWPTSIMESRSVFFVAHTNSNESGNTFFLVALVGDCWPRPSAEGLGNQCPTVWDHGMFSAFSEVGISLVPLFFSRLCLRCWSTGTCLMIIATRLLLLH